MMKKIKELTSGRAKLGKFKRLLKDLKQFKKYDRFNSELDALLKKCPLRLKYPSFPKPPEWDYNFSDIPFKQLRLTLPEEEWEKFCNRWKLNFLCLLLIRPLPFVVRAVAIEWKDPIKRNNEPGMNICVYKYISKNMLKTCLEKAHNIIIESCGYEKESCAGTPINTRQHSKYLKIYKKFQKLIHEKGKSSKEAIYYLANHYGLSRHMIRNIVYPRQLPSVKNSDAKPVMDCINIPMTKYEKSEYMFAALQTWEDLKRIRKN